VQEGGCPKGTWIDVTPDVDLLDDLTCGNYGTKSVQVDPAHPQDLYTLFFCQGIWKSSDYGQTWKGPINTGTNGATFGDCAGGITIPPSSKTASPLLYASCIRGQAIGFWRSTNGGVDWTTFNVDAAPPGASGQQFYPPVVDPYDEKHLLMTGHAQALLLESTNGGESWSALALNSAMMDSGTTGGTGGISFIDTGDPATTRTSWLWMASDSGGMYGTFRTSTGDSGWKKVDTSEHTNGDTQTYTPSTVGRMFMAGLSSTLGAGVLRTGDYGKTWEHVGLAQPESIVFGTPKHVYAMYGWGIGAGGMVAPAFEVDSASGDGTWTSPGTPAAMTQGPAQAAVTSDGKNSILVIASYNAGLWRYLEP
jgi:hypothetical protein